MAELGESSSTSSDVILMNKTKDIIRDVGRYLTDEKLYKPEQVAEVFKLEPSESFVNFLNDLEDQKMVFLMLIHLPERLLICMEQDKGPYESEVIVFRHPVLYLSI